MKLCLTARHKACCRRRYILLRQKRGLVCEDPAVCQLVTGVFFSHTLWKRSGQVTPACDCRSSPPLFAVAAVKMSLSPPCEV